MRQASSNNDNQSLRQNAFKRRSDKRKAKKRESATWRKWTQVYLCLFVLALHVVLFLSPLIERFEFVVLDQFFKSRGAQETHSSIVFVEIAEDGLQDIGRWPWPRQYHAVLTDVLNEWGASAIVFDVIFSEVSDEANDAALDEAIEKTNNVYMPVVLEKRNEKFSWIETLERFSDQAKGVGHINIYPDQDGTIRRVKPYLEESQKRYPYLPLRVVYDFLGEPLPLEGGLPIPLDDDGNMLVNWAGNWKDTFHHYSYVDVLRSYEAVMGGKEPMLDPSLFKGKIVLIGLTAIGHTDIKPSSLEPTYPAVGLHANVMNSILMQQFVYAAPKWVNLVVLLVMGAIAMALFTRSKKMVSIFIGLGLGAAWAVIAYLVFVTTGAWFNVFNPLLLIISLFMVSSLGHLIWQRRRQKELLNLAIRDGLTGLYVIRYFREVLNRAVSISHEHQQTLSLIILDIDFFKKINDTHGHPAGDYILKRTARALAKYTRIKKMKRVPDCLARYGGEEFVVMLSNCKIEDAGNVADRLRRVVEQMEHVWDGKKIPVTISLGVATLHPEEQAPDGMVHRADEALYRAKKNGRNQVCLEEPLSGENDKAN